MTSQHFRVASLLAVVVASGAFNVFPEHAVVFRDPNAQPDSYFGYTVALQRRNGTWLVVGAPRGNSTDQSVTEPGMVYRCAFTQGPCESVLLESIADRSGTTSTGPKSYDEKDGGWVGAAMDVTDEGDLLVCGPRWRRKRDRDTLYMNGLCFMKDIQSDEPSKELRPINIRNQQIVLRQVDGKKKWHPLYAYGEAGMSVHITDSGREMMIGAPGISEWQGGVVLYHGPDGSVVVPNTTMTPGLEEYAYLGYSLCSGTFKPGRTSYVSGAPRAADLRGAVFLFDIPTTDMFQPLSVLAQLQGRHLGEYFGAAVAVGDLTGDGVSELLVGAPLASLGDQHDVGSVYVFLNDGQGELTEMPTSPLIGAKTAGARFGTAVAVLGDLNHDGFADFAVGAPYEDDGVGAVYIYYGSKSGVRSTGREQRIHPQDIGTTSLRGFGVSFSRGVDVDDNGYNDVAVGAYLSGHVVVLTSQPVVSIDASLNTDVNTLSLYDTGFSVRVCLSHKGNRSSEKIDVNLVLTVDNYFKRAWFVLPNERNNSYNANIILKERWCDVFRVEIKKRPKGGDSSLPHPIPVRLLYQLTRSATNCSSCAVLDPLDKHWATKKVDFVEGCGDSSTCTTDLRLDVVVDSRLHPLVVGFTRRFSLHATVSSHGDPAYLPRLRVTMPTGVRSLSYWCGGTTELTCELGHLAEPGSNRTVELVFELHDVPFGTEHLWFVLEASSAGAEMTAHDNSKNVSIPVSWTATVGITGKQFLDPLPYDRQNTTTQLERSMAHVFQITWYGPSPLEKVDVEILVPVGRKNSGDADKTEIVIFNDTKVSSGATGLEHSNCSWTEAGVGLFPGNRSTLIPCLARTGVPCSVGETAQDPDNQMTVIDCLRRDVICRVLRCTLGPLDKPRQRVAVTLNLGVAVRNLDYLTADADKQTVLFATYGHVKTTALAPVDAEIRPTVSVSYTVFIWRSVELGPALWVIVAAAVTGMVILLLVVCCCYKCGFFTRRRPRDSTEESKQMIDNTEENNEEGLD